MTVTLVRRSNPKSEVAKQTARERSLSHRGNSQQPTPHTAETESPAWVEEVMTEEK